MGRRPEGLGKEPGFQAQGSEGSPGDTWQGDIVVSLLTKKTIPLAFFWIVHSTGIKPRVLHH